MGKHRRAGEDEGKHSGVKNPGYPRIKGGMGQFDHLQYHNEGSSPPLPRRKGWEKESEAVGKQNGVKKGIGI